MVIDKSAIIDLDTKNGSPLSPSLSTVILVKEIQRKEAETGDKLDEEKDGQWKTANFINGLHGISIVVVCIILSSPVILIPQHDAIQYPGYWYELLITFSLTYPIHWTLLMILDNQNLLKIKQMLSPKSYLILTFAPILSFILTYCCLYLFWAFYLGYNFPMPLVCFLSQLMWFFFLITMWFMFPKEMRRDQESRKRLKSFVCYMLWVFFITYLYNTLQMMLKKMPSKVQPIMAIILPLMRSIDAKVLKSRLSKCSLGGDCVLESYTTIISNVNFLLYVTISISTNCTLLTTYCILFVDVVCSLYHTFCIMKLYRKVDLDESQLKKREEQKEQNVKILALSEILEIIIPLSYTVTFVVAYYGPNATILRSIKNDYWSNEAVDNLANVLATEALLFSVDFTLLVVVTILLWCFCKINLLREFCGALRRYWFLIAVVAGALISKVTKFFISFFRINCHHVISFNKFIIFNFII